MKQFTNRKEEANWLPQSEKPVKPEWLQVKLPGECSNFPEGRIQVDEKRCVAGSVIFEKCKQRSVGVIP